MGECQGASRDLDTPVTNTQKPVHSIADPQPRCFTVKSMRAVPSRDHSTRVPRLAGCSKLAPALAPRLLCIAKFYLQISTFVEPTSGLEPLTPAHYELACACPSTSHHLLVRGFPKANTRPRWRLPSYCVPIPTNPVAVPLQYVLEFLGYSLCSGLLRVAPYCVPGGVRVVSIPGRVAPTLLSRRRKTRLA